MLTPKISITRHQPGLYEWTLVFDQENIDSDLGETSIAECLSASLSSVPEDVLSVEVSYRGVHMGTFLVQAIIESSDYIAEQISNAYSAFIK